jgi:transposase
VCRTCIHTPSRRNPQSRSASAAQKRLAGDTARAATSDEVKDLRRETSALKEVGAELTLENRLLKKSVTADGEDAT